MIVSVPDGGDEDNLHHLSLIDGDESRMVQYGKKCVCTVAIIKESNDAYPQNKFIKCNIYRNREKSENLMLNFKKKWNTRIKDIIKFKKNNELLINKYVKK